MNILYIMSFIVEKMSDNIHSQANNLINYLPMLWDESKDHNMLRCAIISTLVCYIRYFYLFKLHNMYIFFVNIASNS